MNAGIKEINKLIFNGMYFQDKFPLIVSKNGEDLIWLANLFIARSQQHGMQTIIKCAAEISTQQEAIDLYRRMRYLQNFLIIIHRTDLIPEKPTIDNIPVQLEFICKFHFIFSDNYLYEVRHGTGHHINIASIR